MRGSRSLFVRGRLFPRAAYNPYVKEINYTKMLRYVFRRMVRRLLPEFKFSAKLYDRPKIKPADPKWYTSMVTRPPVEWERERPSCRSVPKPKKWSWKQEGTEVDKGDLVLTGSASHFDPTTGSLGARPKH